MSQVTGVQSAGPPGFQPTKIFDRLGDPEINLLLPAGAFNLLRALDSERITGPRRAECLSQVFSLDLAVDDPDRRRILLKSLPDAKARELEVRTGVTIDTLKNSDSLAIQVRRSLLGFFGAVASEDRFPVPAEAVRTTMPKRGLFPHQKRAATEVERILFREDRRAMLHLPTGVGKTRTAMSIVTSHLRTQLPGLVLWLATTRELLEQAAEEFEAAWSSVGDRPLDCVRFWSQHDPPIETVTDGIAICGLAKLHSFAKNRPRLWDLGDRTSLVVFDEAHQAVAETYEDIVETVVTRNPRTPLLGLSGTPGRTWGDRDVDVNVAELFRGNKVTLDFGGKNPVRELTDTGYLAEVDFSLLNVEPGLQLSSSDIAQVSNALNIPESVAVRLGADEKRNLRIVQRLCELTDRHSRILVFAASVANALLLASVCRGMGFKADVLTGQTNSGDRQRMIRQFKRLDRAKRLLINFGVLTTGFDAPAASAALIARPTKSLVLYSQMVGRVIRGPKASGTDRCEIVTVVDTNLPGFGDVAEAFMNWEDVWNTS
ncbi:MAG: DEAD/DEAH box helicase family protein [Rhodobacteraceae bacterium]|nr:DEAD/DEAH box helicase family protein [Paracoccaceae bacterium]